MRTIRPVVMIATVALTFAWTGTGWAAPVQPGRAAAALAVPGPIAHGTLTITGPLRDGAVVEAGGVRWRPGRLPRSERLLTFAVSYSWQSCAATCVRAADTTATPFAARRYIIGHADTGRRLRLVETASEVVETDAATFDFRVVRASVSVTTAAVVGGYRPGRAPATEFVNGTPEHQTASDAEFFQVDPPHFAAVGGVPVLSYQVDQGSWHPLPASRTFDTGILGVGWHRVRVQTSDRGGSSAISFGWQVVPMQEPIACEPRPGGSCWYPPHRSAAGTPMRWDWQIGRVTLLKRTGRRAVDIYDIDGFLTTRAEVAQVRATWPAATLRHPRLVCYLDMAWEDYRPDASPGHLFPAATLGNVYYGYPQERWVDFRQLDALKPMLDERIAMCARKGFDTVELDDIDGFDPPSTTGFHLTPGDAQNFLAYAFNQIHRDGMTGLWKNSAFLSWWGRSYADGAVVEECYLYRQCLASQLRGSAQYGITCTSLSGATPCGWDDFTTDVTPAQPTGKWVGEAEYSADNYVCNPGERCTGRKAYAAFCRSVFAPPYGFAAVKFDVNLDGAMFYPCPKGV